MTAVQYYIYILRLAHGGYYVGSTRNLQKRLVAHFRTGGSVATKEVKVACIDRIYTLTDYKIGARDAHAIAEVLIAILYAEVFGASRVRGAKHGKGWNDSPSPNGETIIRQIRSFAKSKEGVELIKNLRPFHFENPSYWFGKMTKTPSAFNLI